MASKTSKTAGILAALAIAGSAAACSSAPQPSAAACRAAMVKDFNAASDGTTSAEPQACHGLSAAELAKLASQVMTNAFDSASPASSLVTWEASYGRRDMAGLKAALADVDNSSTEGGTDSQELAGSNLASEAQLVATDPAPPVDAADWHAALSALTVAGNALDTGDLTTALSELTTAKTALDAFDHAVDNTVNGN